MDFQNLLGTQTKIINLGLKIADGLKSLKNVKERGLSSVRRGARGLSGKKLSAILRLFILHKSLASAEGGLLYLNFSKQS